MKSLTIGEIYAVFVCRPAEKLSYQLFQTKTFNFSA